MPAIFKRIWKFISNLGINDQMPLDLRKNITLTNQFAFTWIFIIVLYMTVFFFHDKEASYILGVVLFTHILVLFLNHLHFFNISRLLEGIIPLGGIYLLSALVLTKPDLDRSVGYYFFNISLFVIPFLLFSLKEYWYILICVSFSVFYYISFEWINGLIHLEESSNIYTTKLFEVFNYSISVVLLVIAFVYLKSISSNYQEKVMQLLDDVQIRNRNLELQKKEISAHRDEIEAQRDEITSQRDRIQNQKEKVLQQMSMIVEQTDEINKSILYARRIQAAILPPDEVLTSLFSDYFIYYKPKDIVSGDFYWAQEKNNKIIIAACDCTGHGVPGGFLSMLCSAFIDEVVNKSNIDIQPDIILNELRETIIRSLHQTGKVGEARDGMDMSVCVIDKEKNKMFYAGALNSLLLIREKELIEYKPNRIPIGYSLSNNKKFTGHEINIKKDDLFYIFSDGYVDQFGGEDGKKYLISRFKNLLVEIHEQDLEEQKESLNQHHKQWKGKREQLDDMLVIGFKV